MSKVRICPSVLNANQNDLIGEIRKVQDTADFIHLDIMDGIFVPNTTYDFIQASEIVTNSPLNVDAHLMVQNPESLAPKFAEIGCFSVTFHFEATLHHAQIIKEIKSNGARAAIALKPATEIGVVLDLLPTLDMLLLMTVEPGFGGQKFMVDIMPKIKEASEIITTQKLQDFWLQVDGGISLDTIEIARESGADTFVAGSAVYQAPSPSDMVNQLRAAASAKG